MSWGMVGAAAVGVVGGVMSSKSASKDAKTAAKADAAALDFEKQRYQDWFDVYGPVQDNLAEFYGGLDSDYFEVSGLEALEQEKARAMQNIEDNFSQRGIGNSGLAAAAEMAQELDTAQSRAQVRRNAPLLAAEQKMNFLQVGLGQNPASSVSQALQNQAAGAQGRADASARAAGAATSAAVEGVGKAVSAVADYYRKPETTTNG